MTHPTISSPAEAEAVLKECECGKKVAACGSTEICLTCMRKLNPKEFRETLYDLLNTWTANRPDVEVDELHSLCPAISSMIHLQSRNSSAAQGEIRATA
ncbi:MAG: hypothetical protein ACKN9T_17715 [Candidatus Methylumidiphilus sp.]